ncbi:MAG: hypothetical protein GF405_01035 [Candidatus Eisenbacteria bacterium]|nr:hypothetical protein [Candidatus Eisenbacteria bacterium]
MNTRTLGLIAALLVVATSAAATPVTFQVDMRIPASFELFEPGVDAVELRGSMNGWSAGEHVLSDADGDLVYEITTDLATDTYEYKFVIVRGGQDRWEHSIPNRSVTVTGPSTIPPVFFDHPAGWSPGGTVVGGDLSFVPMLESHGVVYTVDGAPVDLLDAARDHGWGVVRLRLWHTPSEPWHGLDATVAYAHEVKAAGLELMLDFHYSDTWADPGKQYKPVAWQGVPFAALVDSVYAYTNAVVRRFRDEGVLPEYIQVGNEISPGMLWDDGRVGWPGSEWDTPEQWDQFAELLSAGVAGARDSLGSGEETRILIHVAEGCDNARAQWFFDNLLARGVSFDIIGLSFYPWWHGDIWGLRDNLADLAPRYGKELMVVETAYPWTLGWNDDTTNIVGDASQLHPGYDATPEGQFAFLRDVVSVVEATPGGLGTGVVYWEPAWIVVEGAPGCPWENLALFDFDGDALPGFGFAQPWGTGVGEEPPPARPFLSRGSPNPFRESAKFSLSVPSTGARVRVRVFDISGRLVTTLIDQALPGGERTVRWDGRDASGRRVSSGVYMLSAEIEGRRAARKAVRLR